MRRIKNLKYGVEGNMLARRGVEEEAQVKETQDHQDECYWNWLDCTERAMGEALQDVKKRKK
ncbi:hypothetical protein [Desulfobotulus alkaliphilus]|nr:hypothetical protein [Desulfobotulus alkaliphilus]